MKSIASYFSSSARTAATATNATQSPSPSPHTEIQPPNTATKKSISEKNKEYDKKRKRTFIDEWKQEFPWVFLEDNLMYCTPCTKFPNLTDKTSSFYVGCSNYRKGALQSHETNRKHTRCCDALAASENPEDAPMDRLLRAIPADAQPRLEKLFRSAYFVAFHNKPFSDFGIMGELQNLNGANLGSTYLNDHKCKEFINAIDDMFREEMKTVLTNSRMFSILCDGSTDSGTIEEEVFYVRFVRNGEVDTRFLALRAVENGTASGIKSALWEAITEVCGDGVDLKPKIVALGTDGAKVNTGKDNGLVMQLTHNDMPWLKGMWCVAHQLELGLLDSFQKEDALKEAKDLLQGIYKQYKFSAKARRELKTIAEALEEKVLIPSNILGTRWTAHMFRALQSLLQRNFQAIYIYFDNCAESGGKHASDTMVGRSKNIRAKLHNYKFLLFLHLLLDILGATKHLSLQFQSDKCTLVSARDSVKTFLMEIKGLLNHAPNVTQFEQSVDRGSGSDSSDSDGDEPTMKWKGIKLRSSKNDKKDFEQLKKRVVGKVVQYVEVRFGFFETDEILNGLQILDPSNWPEDEDHLVEYGVAELEVVMEFYRPFTMDMGFDEADARHEWSMVKVWGLQRLPMRATAFWNKILTEQQDTFPNISILGEIMLCLPLNTACCERSFSTMKKIKHDWRSSLAPTTLSTLMRISLEGVPVREYNAEPALLHWWTSGERARRPNFHSN